MTAVKTWSTFINPSGSYYIDNNNNEIPYIESVEGVAIVGEVSLIVVHGLNFKVNTQIICSLGEITNIRRNPEKIEFDILASATGSAPIELRNSGLSSYDWDSSYTPLLIARNGLNLTNGWLDFRTADSSGFGSVVSHVNQGLATKTFLNSGYFLDDEKGLCIGATGTNYNASANYIQFNSFSFPLESTKCEFIIINDTTLINAIYPGRTRFSVGQTNENTNKIISGFEAYSIYINIFYEYITSNPLLLQVAPSNSISPNSVYLFKVVFDFFEKTVNVFKLDDLLNFNSAGNFVIKDIPISLLPESERSIVGVPLFNFFNPNSLSSVVAMKIN